jgi:glycosyltransferase involved in cell wall biosynthesis
MSHQTGEVSVVIAAKNAEATIPAALRSILAQTVQPREVIVVDDESLTPLKFGVIAPWGPKVIRLSHSLGPGNARNVGIGETSSKYVAIQDADDVSHPDRLRRSLRALSETDLVGIGTQAVIFGSRGKPRMHPRRPLKAEQIRSAFASGRMRMVHASMTFRRDAWREAGGYPSSVLRGEDFQFISKLLTVGDLSNLPDALYGYRHDYITSLPQYLMDAHGKSPFADSDGQWCGRLEMLPSLIRYPMHVIRRVTSGATLRTNDRDAVREWECILSNLAIRGETGA